MYYKMPKVFHLDDYAPCMSDPDGVYCSVKAALVTDTESELLYNIRNFSEHRVKHYNHSVLRYGVCLTRSCKEYQYDVNKEGDITMVLEQCLNDSMWRKYKLKTKILDYMHCTTTNDKIEITNGDYIVASICCALLIINVIGTAYDFLYVERTGKKGNQFLLIFSIKKNWAKLVSPFNETDPRLARIKGFNGGRTITTALVITVHALLPLVSNPHDARDLEAVYDLLPYHTFINGTPIVQTFFIMSGFLLTYNFQLKSEKKTATWHMIPTGILLRWLRLTPVYALVLAITATWLRLIGSGPIWHMMVIGESDDCRRDAWQNMLYINNYFDNTQCMAQCWYLAADMQLYCVGLLVCVLIKTNTSRKLVLSLLLVIGLIIPPVITYVMDLDAVLIVAPETAFEFFVSDPTFNYIYKRTHTNLVGYVMGMGMGFIAYHLQNQNFKINKYKKYLWLYQLLFPTGLMITWLGSVFYRNAPRDPVYVRALYAGIVKPLFTSLIALLFFGLVFKCDKIHRGVLEWRCWTTTGRISYCAYILHVLVIRTYTGAMTSTDTVTSFHALHSCIGSVVVTFLAAVPLWLLVEAPMSDVVKLIFPSVTGGRVNQTTTTKQRDCEIANL